MTCYLVGLGTATPPHFIVQADAAEQAGTQCDFAPAQRRMMEILYRRSGVRRRHSVVLQSSTGDEPAQQSFYPHFSTAPGGPGTAARMELYRVAAGSLAREAAHTALASAGVEPRRITHLITASCTGFAAPNFDIDLFRDLPLSPQVARTHVGFMGCHGALNALRVAQAFATADPAACVLIAAVELCSLHHQYRWDPELMVANALFADGAAAAVICGTEAASAIAPAPGAAPRWTLAGSGSIVATDEADAMGWQIGDHGFVMSLSARTPDLIAQRIGPWLAAWLDRYDLAVSQIGCWGIHPGGPRIVEAVGAALGLSEEQTADSRNVLADYGNMSSPTLLFVLQRLQARGAAPPCVLLGFGPGLTIEAALLTA